MNKFAAIALVAFGAVLGLLTLSSPVFAHHGTADYDTTKTIVVKGTVSDYIWANPHVYLRVDVKDESGNMQRWIIEAQNPVIQANAGWSRTTFKPGDEVIVDVTPKKSGSLSGRFKGRIVINGEVFKP